MRQSAFWGPYRDAIEERPVLTCVTVLGEDRQ